MTTILEERLEHREPSTRCGSYGPGHMLHWQHWKKATGASCVQVTHVIQTGASIELVVPGRSPLRWYHHDPDRLRLALQSAQQPILACPQWQALRVDGYWFNCAPSDSSFARCH